MPYKLTYIDGVPLPDGMPEDDLSTGTVESSLVDSVGATYDYFGATQRLPRRQQFKHKGKYVGEVLYRVTGDGDFRVTDDGEYRTVAPSKLADLHAKTNDLKAKIGVLCQVWRERLADGEMSWKSCRLLNVNHVEKIDNANVVSEVTSTFETQDIGWRDEVATTVTKSVTGGVAPTILNVQNSGSMVVSDAILTVQRTSGTITSVNITGPGIDITWSGSIGSGQTLEIDAGLQTIMVSGSNAYDGLEFNAGHTVNEWLPLNRGTTMLSVTVVGGNANVSVEHYNQTP